MAEIVNRVANSGLITLNLEDHFPDAQMNEVNMKNYLLHELEPIEKVCRSALTEIEWSK